MRRTTLESFDFDVDFLHHKHALCKYIQWLQKVWIKNKTPRIFLLFFFVASLLFSSPSPAQQCPIRRGGPGGDKPDESQDVSVLSVGNTPFYNFEI